MYEGYTSEQYGHVLPGGTNRVHVIGLYDSNNNEVGHASGSVYIKNDNNNIIFYVKPYSGHEYGTFLLEGNAALPSGNYTLKVNYNATSILNHDFDIPIQVPSEYYTSPNPVVLTRVQAPAGEKTFVSIYDNGELLTGGVIDGHNKVGTVALYQNGVQVGITGDTTWGIYYNTKLAIALGSASADSGYTFHMQLRNGIDYQHGPILPNGDYDLVVRYNPNSKNYTVPIRVAAP